MLLDLLKPKLFLCRLDLGPLSGDGLTLTVNFSLPALLGHQSWIDRRQLRRGGCNGYDGRRWNLGLRLVQTRGKLFEPLQHRLERCSIVCRRSRSSRGSRNGNGCRLTHIDHRLLTTLPQSDVEKLVGKLLIPRRNRREALLVAIDDCSHDDGESHHDDNEQNNEENRQAQHPFTSTRLFCFNVFLKCL